MSSSPPEYILAQPHAGRVPEILASCDAEDIDDLRLMKQDGQYIYHLVKRFSK